MFIDEIKIKVKAGTGGNGCCSFRREKFVPRGGPDGGNGGRGGSIVFAVDPGLKTLIDLRYQKLIKAKNGAHGSGKNKHGKSAPDVVVKVPPGTIIKANKTILADLVNPTMRVVVAQGGRGGRGNKAFVSALNTAPREIENGEPGEERELIIELKLLADVGLVGLPNAGKSTILAKVSAAKPKIAAYPFTTLVPNLGVVKIDTNASFVIADIPGLIQGAAHGEGLGVQFLKHIERTKVLAHVIDMSGEDPNQAYQTINQELAVYGADLSQKPQLILANKMDLAGAKANLKNFQAKVKEPVYLISALNGEGLKSAMAQLLLMVQAASSLNETGLTATPLVYKFEKKETWTIKKIKEGWLVEGAELARLLQMANLKTHEGALRFARKLQKLGVDEALKKKGAKPGDLVKILDFEFEYEE